MSRATVDLQSIRFFLGYGLIFITQNLLTIVLASAVMVAINPLAGAARAGPGAARRLHRRPLQPASPGRPLQEVQQRIAELTAEAEENISGIRIVKAFAREEHQLHRFRRAVGRVFDQSIYSTRLQAFFSPLIGLLPQLGIALVLLVGGRQVINGSLSLGDFTAFYTYLVILAGPMRMLGMALGMAQRAIASGNRLFEILDREPRIESPPGAPPLPAGRRPGRDARRHACATTAPSPALDATIDLEVEAGPDGGAGRPLGLGQDQPGGADRPPLRPQRGRGRWSTAPTCASVDVGSLRSRDRLRRRRQLPLLGHRRREHRLRPPGRDPRGDRGGGAARPGGRLHPRAARRLRDAWSASAG